MTRSYDTPSSIFPRQVTVRAPNPHNDLFQRIMLACDDPTYADVIFVFADDEVLSG